MTPQTQIRIAIIAIGVIALIAVARETLSSIRIARLEKAAAAHRTRADELGSIAANRETAAEAHVAKIKYLEQRIAESREIAKRQDEDTNKKLSAARTARDARDARDRSRRVVPTPATADELCAKLGEIGHACE